MVAPERVQPPISHTLRRRRGRGHVLYPSQLCDRLRPGRVILAVGLAGDPAGDRAAEADALHVGRAPPAARQVPARKDAVGHQAVAKVPERRLEQEGMSANKRSSFSEVKEPASRFETVSVWLLILFT